MFFIITHPIHTPSDCYSGFSALKQSESVELRGTIFWVTIKLKVWRVFRVHSGTQRPSCTHEEPWALYYFTLTLTKTMSLLLKAFKLNAQHVKKVRCLGASFVKEPLKPNYPTDEHRLTGDWRMNSWWGRQRTSMKHETQGRPVFKATLFIQLLLHTPQDPIAGVLGPWSMSLDLSDLRGLKLAWRDTWALSLINCPVCWVPRC